MYRFGFFFTHCFIVVNYQPFNIFIINDKMPQCFANAGYKVVKVVIAVAIEVLKNAVFVETKCASYIAFAYFFGLKRTYANNQIVFVSFGL